VTFHFDKELYGALSALILAFVIAFLLTPLVRLLAVKGRVLDLPNRRKIHKSATPLLGGFAIYAGVLAALFITAGNLKNLFPLLVAGTVILIVGFINDVKERSPEFRLAVQALCTLFLIATGSRIDFLPRGFLGDAVEILITLVWVVGITNAFNYLDGMDGLAAGSAALSLLCYAVILYNTKQFSLMIFAIALMASCLGFLPYNFRRNKIFLGDTGSTFLGFALASIALVGNWANDNIVKISIPVLIMGVPIFDMIFTTVMRIKEGKVKSVKEWLQFAGKDHIHHSLVDLGLHTRGAVAFIYLITFSLGVSAIMISGGRARDAFLSLVQGSIALCAFAILLVVGKRHRSGWEDLRRKEAS
jgi:UDP-GlcNAc:undecaprenyl-phosphate GlcNAc-1-phosphate transferase